MRSVNAYYEFYTWMVTYPLCSHDEGSSPPHCPGCPPQITTELQHEACAILG